MHAVMKHWHPMMGVDFHIPWPPGSPSPAPAPVPYRTGMVLMGTGVTASMCPTHNSQGYGITMLKSTDIGPMIPHVGPPSITLPLEIVFSASKSYFGVARNPACGRPICVALAGLANFNLNCGTPVPTPTGVVAALNTHLVEMSMADLMHGLTEMAFDWALQSALQYVGGRIGEGLGAMVKPYAAYLTMRFGPKIMSRQAAKLFLRSAGVKGRDINNAARALRESQREALGTALQRSDTIAGMAADVVTGWFLGGPMGIDNATVGGPTATDMVGGAINDYANSPSVPEHPSSGGGGGGGAPPSSGGGGGPDAGTGGAGAGDAGGGGDAPDAGPPAGDSSGGAGDAGPSDAGPAGGPNSSSDPDDGGVCMPDE